MESINDITGDKLKSKPATDLYYEGYDRIFGNKKKEKLECDVEKEQEELLNNE